MSNIEEDIRILEDWLKVLDDFFEKTRINNTKERNALRNALAERKQDKARIQELEEENRIQRKQIMSAYNRGWLPKQKVKDKIERHEFAKKDFEKEYDNKNYKDDDLRVRDFYMIVAEDLIIKNLKDLLEDK